jgi:Mannosylglycerate hydrolase MGH1-like glycoside hydrolase domain
MSSILFKFPVVLFLFCICSCNSGPQERSSDINLNNKIFYGKKDWEPMLKYTFELHKKSTHEQCFPFIYEWEEIGPGYCYAPAFGHWDIVYQVMDAFVYDKEHGLRQLYNNIVNQTPTGMIPGSIWMPGGKSDREKADWNKETEGHPPVWMNAVDDYVNLTGNDKILKDFYIPLIRQINWFENNRKAVGEGFFYNDILLKLWESGVDEGVRFDETGLGPWACIDATCHVYKMYEFAEKWSEKLGFEASVFKKRKNELKHFIQDSMYVETDKMFYDIWAVNDPSLRHIVYENLWPVITGCATKEQAEALIDNYILDTTHFFTPHPISTVSVSDPKFELRLWRGPTWNSVTLWISKGCLNYGRDDAALSILEKALDMSAIQFEKTGTIWEFYHPFGGEQTELLRKPKDGFPLPSKDYLGHNPLLAMAKLYDKIKNPGK